MSAKGDQVRMARAKIKEPALKSIENLGALKDSVEVSSDSAESSLRYTVCSWPAQSILHIQVHGTISSYCIAQGVTSFE